MHKSWDGNAGAYVSVVQGIVSARVLGGVPGDGCDLESALY